MAVFSYTQYVLHLIAESRLQLNTKQAAFLARNQWPRTNRSFRYPNFLISRQLRLADLESTHLFEAKQVACSLQEARHILYGDLPLIQNKFLTVPVGAALYLIEAMFSKAESSRQGTTLAAVSPIASASTDIWAVTFVPSESGSEAPSTTPPTSASPSRVDFPAETKAECATALASQDATRMDPVVAQAKEGQQSMPHYPTNATPVINDPTAIVQPIPLPPPDTSTTNITPEWRRREQGNGTFKSAKKKNPKYGFKRRRPLLHSTSWRL